MFSHYTFIILTRLNFDALHWPQMIFDLFRDLNRKGLTLVIVTHNLDLARQAQKMYTLRDGQIVGCEDLTCVLGRSDTKVQQEVV